MNVLIKRLAICGVLYASDKAYDVSDMRNTECGGSPLFRK